MKEEAPQGGGAILSPGTIWNGLDTGLDVSPVLLDENEKDGVTTRYMTFMGRDSGDGRAEIFCVLAFKKSPASANALLILPDAETGIDEEFVRYMANQTSFTVCMMDYAGIPDAGGRHTVYPESVSYAYYNERGRHADYADVTADRTSWYEWTADVLYAKKFLTETLECARVAVMGIRCGGEIAWKAITASDFSCAAIISAAGWKTYEGVRKFSDDPPPEMDGERYRFLAGVDSQAYAPYVRCPVLMICGMNEEKFDCDRAFDTFSRINFRHAAESSIIYCLPYGNFLDENGERSLFMFLYKYEQNRSIFIPRSSQIKIYEDDMQNLSATVNSDRNGQIESAVLFYAEDELSHFPRSWTRAKCRRIDVQSGLVHFEIRPYRETRRLFAVAGITYSSGFTAWTKIHTVKISGLFRNSLKRTKLIYMPGSEEDDMTPARFDLSSAGGFMVTDCATAGPETVTEDGIKGIYSPLGIATRKISSARFAPDDDSLLCFEIYADSPSDVTVSVFMSDGTEYMSHVKAYGGTWQSVTLSAGNFISSLYGRHLLSFLGSSKINIYCATRFAVNNLMWV